MLASPADLDAIKYPIFASPKLDGIRASVVGGKLLSRTLKEIPNRHIFNTLSVAHLEGLDGELIVGDITSPTCYRDTVSGVMSEEKVSAWSYHVFDLWTHSEKPFAARRDKLANMHAMNGRIKLVEHELMYSREALDEYEAEQVGLGHEGIMLADPNAAYKFGRATTKGGELLKVKRFSDFEATVLDVVEEEHNANEAEVNELGRTKRSSAQAGKIGKGSMGALHVRDNASGIDFHIGTGFTAADRAALWVTPPIGKVIKYKSFEVGVKIKPRHPVFLGFRPEGA